VNSFRKLRIKLAIRTFPRRVLCALMLNRHRWGEASAVIIDGPLNLPPRERGWSVLAFHKQCKRCYTIRDVGYSFQDAESAVRREIEEDEGEG
jgi:hypothetical protein